MDKTQSEGKKYEVNLTQSKTKGSFCLSIIGAGGVNSGAIWLYNDSPFILTATIIAADGTYLGQFTVQPGQQSSITQNLFPTTYQHPGAPTVSMTPYTVIWQCPSEEYFSTSTQVSPGSLVRASDGTGNHFCDPKKKAEKEAPASTLKKKK